MGGAEGGRRGGALGEDEGETGEGRSARCCQEQEEAQRASWGVRDGGSAEERGVEKEAEGGATGTEGSSEEARVEGVASTQRWSWNG